MEFLAVLLAVAIFAGFVYWRFTVAAKKKEGRTDNGGNAPTGPGSDVDKL